MKRHYLTTTSGAQLFYERPDPGVISIGDIARGGSRDCRYAGQLKGPDVFYSVAQHAVIVSYCCNREDAKHGLLHDASEAFIRDIPSGLKQLPEMAGYRHIEKAIQDAVYESLGLSTEIPASVKIADKRVAATEAMQLLATVPEWVGQNGFDPIQDLRILPLPPAQAEAIFLHRFEELFGIPFGTSAAVTRKKAA